MTVTSSKTKNIRVKFLKQGPRVKLAYSTGTVVELPRKVVARAIKENVCVETNDALTIPNEEPNEEAKE